MGRRTTWLAVALLGGTVVAGCGGDNVQDEMATRAVEEAMRPEALDTTAAARLSGELVRVTLTEWSIQAAPAEMPAGQITFNVVNAGQVAHDLEVEGQDEEWELDGELSAAESGTLTVTLPPGTYVLYCPLETEHGEHDELGMRTTLVVR